MDAYQACLDRLKGERDGWKRMVDECRERILRLVDERQEQVNRAVRAEAALRVSEEQLAETTNAAHEFQDALKVAREALHNMGMDSYGFKIMDRETWKETLAVLEGMCVGANE